MYGFVKLLNNFFGQWIKVFQPASISLAKDQNNLQKNDVILFGFVFCELRQSFIDIAGLSGKFFS